MKVGYRSGSAVLLVPILAALVIPQPKVRTETGGGAHAGRRWTGIQAATASRESKEQAYRLNNVGVALLEQYKFEEAAEDFRRALKIYPGLGIAHLNLCLALFYEPSVPQALTEAKLAAAALPDAPQPFYMLGLIARQENRSGDAVSAFKKVLEIDQADVGSNVNLGELYNAEGQNLYREGKQAEGIKKYTEAAEALSKALSVEPYNITAAYNLFLALQRSRQAEKASVAMKRFLDLRHGGYGTTLGQKYLEQGRYAEGISSRGLEPDLVDSATPEVAYHDVTALVLPPQPAQQTAAVPAAVPDLFGRTFKASDLTYQTARQIAAAAGGSALLFDYNGDGLLDLFVVDATGQHLYENECGKFVDVTEKAGLSHVPPGAIGIGAVAGDYDNDGKPDLFVLRYGQWSLYHNDGGGKFSDVTAAAGIPDYPFLALTAAFVDTDHDGNLDIFIGGLADLKTAPAGSGDRTLAFPQDFKGAPNLLLRNDGKGKFSDVTAAAGIGGPGHAIAVIPTDYDNHRDVDLLVVNYGAAPNLFSNQRDGSFRDVAKETGLAVSGNFISATACDVNKDGYTDFFLGKADGPGLIAMSDGHLHFALSDAPPITADASAAQFLDYDNDGLVDLVTVSRGQLHVLRNLGQKLVDVTAQAVPNEPADPDKGTISPRGIAAGDLSGNESGDLAIEYPGRGVRVIRNDQKGSNRSISVDLSGKVSNRSGIGSKIEMRAGSLWQKLETSSATPAAAPADVIFGLGHRAAPDAVRILWPSGVVQSEIEFHQGAPRGLQGGCGDTAQARQGLMMGSSITELDRKPSSCPFLFTWNGREFEFVTDFLGAGEMGDWEAPAEYDTPEPVEYVRITGDQLKPRNGVYQIRVTNELEEAMYLDQVHLVAVAHPAGTEVFPPGGLSDPPKQPSLIYTTRGAHPPVAAKDDQGRDILEAVSKEDRQFADGFATDSIRGYAKLHSITLDLGRTSDKRTLLLLTGWTDYAFSSDNVAASHSGMKMVSPYLQVKDEAGNWKTVIDDIGFPIGRPQTVVVDLTGKFLTASREVRIVTNMRVYWDRILVDTSGGNAPFRLTRLNPLKADLRWRGFSAEVTPDGREPLSYDYDQVSLSTPWKQMTGRYTREGDVRALLKASDDMFVVSRSGDEIALEFDASRLPPLPAGWTRTFLLCADGFSKEMDINSASPFQVDPLPYHGMKRYPYKGYQGYPMTAARRRYIDKYNTRLVIDTLPPIDTLLLGQTASNSRLEGRR